VRSGKRAPPSPPDEPGVRALAAAFVVDPSDAWDETFFSSKFADCGRRDETCPVSTEGGTRRVQLVREGGGGGALSRSASLDASLTAEEADMLLLVLKPASPWAEGPGGGCSARQSCRSTAAGMVTEPSGRLA